LAKPVLDFPCCGASPLRSPGALYLGDSGSPIAHLSLDDFSDFLLHRAPIPFRLCLEGADDLRWNIADCECRHDSTMLASCSPPNKRFEGTRGSVVGVRLTSSLGSVCARAPSTAALGRQDYCSFSLSPCAMTLGFDAAAWTETDERLIWSLLTLAFLQPALCSLTLVSRLTNSADEVL
jgi:hypothetical protein